MAEYKKDDIKENLFDLYSLYAQHKLLFAYYMRNRNRMDNEVIIERLNYLKKNPNIKQRSELETLLWILGEIDDEETNN